MGSRRFSFGVVLMSLVGAVIAFGLGEMILLFGRDLPSFVKVGLYFGVGAMAVAGMVFMSQKASPQLVGNRWKERYYKTALKWYVPVTLLMVGIVAGVFQFIFSLDVHEENVVKNIVIAIDNSESMKHTDAERERYNAIGSLIDNLAGDKRVAIISFNDDPTVAIDFTEVETKAQKEALKAQISSLAIEEDGQTGIRKAVDDAYNMLHAESGKGSLILVSDGAPTDGSDEDIPGLVSNYVAEKMPIYTIGMMYNAPDTISYLQTISELTDAVCYDTSDTTMLKEAFGKISYNEEKGTIVTAGSGAYMTSKFYKGLRIAFLVILSMGMALGLGIMFDNRYLVKGMLVGSFIGGLVGSLVMVLMMAGGTIDLLARLYYWGIMGAALMAFTWCFEFKDSYHGTREA